MALRRKLEQEEQAYASLLAQLDALASFPPPFAGEADLAQRINSTWETPDKRQVAFNSAVVQLLNGHLESSARLRAHLAQVV